MQRITVVENITVEGLITRRSHRNIEVEITSPYSGLRTDLTIPLLAAGSFTFLGPEGDRAARSLLRTLYGQAQFMVAQQSVLKEQWRETKQAIAEQSLDPGADQDELRAGRSRLRRRFKAGLIRQREYQAEVRRLNQLRSGYEGRRKTLVDGFMAEWSWGLDLAQVLVFIGEQK